MRINTRFTVAVHVLALLALSDKPVTSEMMALSVGTHPVAIRQIMSDLKKAGLIETQNGLPGGRLTRSPGEITLCDVYQAIRDPEKTPLFDVHRKPNPLCPVGCSIRGALDSPLAAAQAAMENSLRQQTMQDITDYILAMHENAENGGICYESI